MDTTFMYVTKIVHDHIKGRVSNLKYRLTFDMQ